MSEKAFEKGDKISMDQSVRSIDSEKNREIARQTEMKHDKGVTLGPDQRNPCKGESKALRDCLIQQRLNGIVTCDEFRQYEKNCRRFWEAVQNYREKNLDQSVLKYPQNLDTWRAKMPEFYLTGRLVPPENPSA